MIPWPASSMDIAGLNDYQPREDDPNFWMNFTWHQDMHRTAYGRTHFITTENRFGVTGDTRISDPSPTREQFLMWGLEAAAFGTCGLFYWTGNRWRGGHWPQWGGLLDWSGHPEPDFDWAVELGRIFAQWGKHLIDNPVKATAVVLTDFNQRAALEIYPHIISSSYGATAKLRRAAPAWNRCGQHEPCRRHDVGEPEKVLSCVDTRCHRNGQRAGDGLSSGVYARRGRSDHHAVYILYGQGRNIPQRWVCREPAGSDRRLGAHHSLDRFVKFAFAGKGTFVCIGFIFHDDTT